MERSARENGEGAALAGGARRLLDGRWVAFWALCAGALVVMVGAHAARPGGIAATFVAWAAMVIAMMAPTAVPMLRAVGDLAVQRGAARWSFWAFLGGYGAVWLAASTLFAAAQLGAGRVPGTSPPLAWAAVGGVLLLAGAYQLTAVKDSCARRCRSPLAFLLARWRPGTGGIARLGVRHGIDCVGCCWALMLLTLVGGTVRPVLMALVMVVAAVEKLPRIGARVSRPVGLALLLAAGASFVVQLGLEVS